jgi:uncharacterized spore protein YtfJ
MTQRLLTFGLCSLLLVLPWSLLGQASAPLSAPLSDLDKMISSFSSESVIGKPIQSGTTIIIPFSRIKFGLGAGGAVMGFGAGLGAKVVPMGFLVISGEDVRIELLPVEEKKPSWFQQFLPTLLKMLPMLRGGESAPPAKTPPPPRAEKDPAPSSGDWPGELERLLAEGEPAQALARVETLLAGDPENAELHAWKGSIMGRLAQSGNPADLMKYGLGAMQEFESALALDPENIRARLGRGIGRLQAPQGFGGDPDGAVEDLRFVSERKPIPEAFFYLGRALEKKGLTVEAKDAYKKALALRPDYEAASRALAAIE